MFVCGFWFLALVTDVLHYNRAKLTLAVFMLVATLHLFCQAAYCSLEYDLTRRIDPVYVFTCLAVFPLYYLYVKTLTDPEGITLRSLWVLLPAILSSLVSFVLYRFMPVEETNAFVHQVLYRENGDYVFSMAGQLQKINTLFVKIALPCEIVPVFLYGFKRIRAYNAQVAEYYSNQEGKAIDVSRWFLFAFIITSALCAIFNAIGRHTFIQPVEMLFIPSGLYVLMLFPLGFAGFRQEFMITDLLRDESREESTFEAMPENFSEKQFKQNLFLLIGKEEIYTKPNLRITDVAVRLGCSRNYLSRFLNQKLQTNFSDFINKFRVEHAKRLLSLTSEMRITSAQIVDAAGFASESSFYRIFKSIEGKSPKAWKSTHLQQN
ncbi:hypothetical protein AGMMS49574_28440 [Bacteroidia bacterium]|nr:hypothetical protein AGMMS49574_28440 [Bacteroidia bacterium]